MIYLIDDDKSVRRGFELFIKSAGMKFRSMECAEDFLCQFMPEDGDLVVLDISLPGMTGGDLLKRFAEMNIHIPVIVVTSSDEPGSKEICRKYGVKAYLRKPVDGEALMDLIKFHMQV